jgi:hypothetical protein
MRIDRSGILATLVTLSLPLACSSVPVPGEPLGEGRPDENVSTVREAFITCQTPLGDIAVCPNTSGCCSGACTDLQFNSTSCGACGAKCGLFKGCSFGHCCNVGTMWCPSKNACGSPCDCTPDAAVWLDSHPRVAAAIKWQVANTTGNAYAVADQDKQPWTSWPSKRRGALLAQFAAHYAAICSGHPPPDPVADPIANLSENIALDDKSPVTQISPTDAETLYLAIVAQSLAVEIGHFVPWSIAGYDDESLAVLFDSATMMSRRLPSQSQLFSLGDWYSPWVAPTRAGNRGRAVPAPPGRAFAFMKGGLVGASRHATIVNVMQWGHDNMVHFYGNDTFLNDEQTWGYRGHPPVTRVISGTTSTSSEKPADQPAFSHWTAGCHGTAGFLREVLRSVNIPVQIPHACGHSQLYFRTEGLYVDHADDLYSGYGTFPVSMEGLLIDQATYSAWFGDNLLNEDWLEKLPAEHCQNVGRRIAEQMP